MKKIKIFEELREGWGYPYRSKKAHYFIDKKSLCRKHTISEWEESGLLPTSTFSSKNQLCYVCMDKLSEKQEAQEKRTVNEIFGR